MTGAQALDMLMFRFGNRSAAALRANTLAEMIYVQTMLELGGELPWFIIGVEETFPVIAKRREVLVSDTFLREVEEIPVYILDTAGNRHEVIKKDYYELANWWTMEATSELPENYALVGLNINLFPMPLLNTSLKIRVYQKQVPPTDDASEDDLWLRYAPDLLLALTGEQVAMKLLKDPELTQAFLLDKTAAFARLIVDNTARTEVGRARMMG